jgi:hypothetical protein
VDVLLSLSLGNMVFERDPCFSRSFMVDIIGVMSLPEN